MKNIQKYIGVLILVFTLFACDEESNFDEFNAVLTPVYSLTNISNGPHKINVYKEKALIVEYITEVNVKSFQSSGYTDASTDTNFEVSVTKTLEDGSTQALVISADKASGAGTLTIDGTTIHDIVLKEEDVYN
ncbi:hypothetical protein [Seonamhaeicola marinus]|uniref:Uncharacterized protein n=1 Tax=Seonamhaeicola marinus TaxID=1912246 RepID=A0A5D0J9F0_9FLAO|nr:hypothetical protein [Seonamhaeicola marinus]TYA92141.1 hypothetical protein FUA24_01545 [Seonamhaeicola marinus]